MQISEGFFSSLFYLPSVLFDILFEDFYCCYHIDLHDCCQGNKVSSASKRAERPCLLVTEELEPLSRIITELNTQFGTDFNENDKVCILAIEERLFKREDLKDSIRVNKPDDAMLTFNHALTEVLQSMVDTHFKFYKHVNDDKDFAEHFTLWLFERYQQQTE